jgi:hypothetical protein
VLVDVGAGVAALGIGLLWFGLRSSRIRYPPIGRNLDKPDDPGLINGLARVVQGISWVFDPALTRLVHHRMGREIHRPEDLGRQTASRALPLSQFQ